MGSSPAGCKDNAVIAGNAVNADNGPACMQFELAVSGLGFSVWSLRLSLEPIVSNRWRRTGWFRQFAICYLPFAEGTAPPDACHSAVSAANDSGDCRTGNGSTSSICSHGYSFARILLPR